MKHTTEMKKKNQDKPNRKSEKQKHWTLTLICQYQILTWQQVFKVNGGPRENRLTSPEIYIVMITMTKNLGH